MATRRRQTRVKTRSRTPTPPKVFDHTGSPLRAALYCRVSTAEQQTLPAQMSALEDYAAKRGWVVTMRVAEVGSGAAHRPKREELLAAARRRKVDVIAVLRLDRWGRSVADLVTTIDDLRHIGVAFASATEALDLTTPSGRALAGMLSVFADFERDVLRSRVIDGLAAARARGTKLGRPRTRDAHVAEVRRLAGERMSQAGIARRLGVTRGMVRRILASSANEVA